MEFFKNYPIKAIGVGSFGPIDVNRENPTYINITSTAKKDWWYYPFTQTLEDSFSVPVGFNTDVNAAALGEVILGAAQEFDSCSYITVGTGIGAGAIVQGKLLQWLSHPEMGQILVRRHPDDTMDKPRSSIISTDSSQTNDSNAFELVQNSLLHQAIQEG
ncbi:ROK family protein [Peribacillus muralis]|uniref:ROK family protein n=1 Tax=Peribacillus muralis TaxID=264697 RepID=UPI0039B77D95